ncbi:unnamed protein product [Thelazia callipaeda]|uniref:ADP-ribosylhydrolase ARH3 n=1 Tax=Thelazia callipaeda TaxID=103827 RepID=A0A0N5CSM3_THECL|nr:unnamed protein product [Thelazia callipaeda]
MQCTTKRALGCLYGQVIGDSLGSRYEFQSASTVQRMILSDSVGSFLPMLGGGPLNLRPGQVTDDSEMALSLASSIIRCNSFNAADIACSYVYWAQSKPLDIGKATHNALTIGKQLSSKWHDELIYKEKELIHQEVIKNVKDYNVGSLSNGCLMRISPLAIYSINNKSTEQVEEMVRMDCSLTHYEEDTKQAAFSYVTAIRNLLIGKSNKEAYEAALNVVKSTRIRDHLLTAQEKPVPVNTGKRFVNGDREGMGYIGVALQSAFYELLHGTSFEKSVISAISRGGDTDTNGAIVGALTGARFGIDLIPKEWVNTIKKSSPRDNFRDIDYNVEQVVDKLLKIV